MSSFNNTNVVFFEDEDFTSDGKLHAHDDKPVMIMIFGEGCPHCQHVKPDYIQLANNNRDVVYGVIPTDGKYADKTLLKRLSSFIPDIRGIPTFVLFKNGKYVKTHKGDRKRDKLRKFSLS